MPSPARRLPHVASYPHVRICPQHHGLKGKIGLNRGSSWSGPVAALMFYGSNVWPLRVPTVYASTGIQYFSVSNGKRHPRMCHEGRLRLYTWCASS